MEFIGHYPVKHIRGVHEVKERERGTESLFKEIIAENISNLGIDMDIYVKFIGSQVQSKEGFTKTHYNKHVKIKDKERILKAA